MPTGQADRLMPTLRRVVMARQSAARTDGELLGAFVRAADADAFAELVRRHGPMVLGVCRRVVGDHTTADDAFQAAFLVLARRAASVRPRERVGNWLYGVAYRTALKARTVLVRRRSREKQVDVMPEPTAPTAAPAWADLQSVIDEELARLPDKLRLPVVLCDLEGRPQREVAKHLNVPPATLATRLASARRTLAARLTRRGIALSGGALAGLLGLHASASAVPHALAAGVVRAVGPEGVVNTLVSAQAVQLSEGVIRMLMLAKLKAVAVLAAVALALTTGLGVGLVPASADDQPGPTGAVEPRPAAQPAPDTRHKANARPKDSARTDPGTDDMTFLRRLSLEVRGTVPTDVEMWLFASDADDDKRAKVVEWITDDDATRAFIAKKLGVPVERVRVIRARLAPDQKNIVLVTSGPDLKPHSGLLTETLTFAPDGKKLVVNETYSEVTNAKKDAVWIELGTKQAGDVRLWDFVPTGEKKSDDSFFRDLAVRAGKGVQLAWATDEKQPNHNFATFDYVITNPAGSDAEFLKRVLADVRGSGPTALETKYFTEDKDPKKREKLVDTLLKDPAVQKKLGDEWKKKVLATKPPTPQVQGDLFYYLLTDEKHTELVLPNRPHTEIQPPKVLVAPAPPKPPVPPKPTAQPGDKLEKLVGELIAAKKSDEALLEAITLATLSRLPTDSEKKLALAVLSSAADRKAAWIAMARALAGSDPKKADVPRFQIELVPGKP